MTRRKTKKRADGPVQLPLWTPESDWRPTPLADLPSWEGAKRIGIDTETRDDHLRELGPGVRRGGYAVGFSVAIEDGPSFYLPTKHELGDNLDHGQTVQYLRDNAKLFDGDYVGANLAYDLDYWMEEGIEFNPEAKFKDVLIADALIYELHDSYSLDAVSKRHGLPGKNEDLLRQAADAYGVDPKGGLWRLPARFVGPYADDDGVLPLQTLRRQERHIDDLDLWDVWDLEVGVTPVLVRMRRRGVRVDQDRLREIEEWTLVQEAERLTEIKRLTGWEIAVGDVWKAAAVAPAFEAIGVELPKTAKGAPSIDQELFARIGHPVADHVAWARKANKLRTTFAAGVRKYMTNGRVHCTFNQMAKEDEKGDFRGARYGRLSSSDPNLQNQPSRDEFASMWRSIYLPEEGSLWASNDYSQQEPRWTTHFAALAGFPGATEACQEYHQNPDLDNHQFMAELTGLDRKYAKQIFLGLCYGEGGAKLCRELGLPTRWALGRGYGQTPLYFETFQEVIKARAERGSGFTYEAAGEEGQRILDTFDERAPYIRKVMKMASARAKSRGFIITGGGRRLHFPRGRDGDYEFTYRGLNRVIQGTSADQMKKAMVEIDRAGHHIMLQIHDDAPNSVEDEVEARAIAEIMENIMPARVPFRVDTSIGPSWGEAK